MTAVALDETPILCVLCPPQRAKVSRPGGLTDWDCHERLAAQITEVEVRYAKLSARPGGGVGTGRRAPGFRSTPPVNLHVAALRDPRTAPAELGELHAPLNFVLTWCRWMRVTRGQSEAQYPAALRDGDQLVLHVEVEYLLNAMDWITRQPWVATFAYQLRHVVSQLRSATGEPNPRPVGRCPRMLETGPCGHPLFPPRGDDTSVACGACDAVYAPLDLIRIAKGERAGCARCGHTDSQHSNDDHVRACNVRWCDCPGYRDIEREVLDRADGGGPGPGGP